MTTPKLSNEGTLTPAYGRDYKSKAAAIEDFRKGRDFVYMSPYRVTYCSIRDFSEGDLIKIRYDDHRKACFYTITSDDL